MNQFPAWRNLLRDCGLPVVLSLQGVDLLMTNMKVEDFKGIELIGAPFSHILPSLYEKGGPRMRQHLKWQFQEAAVNPLSTAYFTPEFDIPRTPGILPRTDSQQIIFAIPAGNTLAYSECDAGSRRYVAEGCLEEFEAIAFHDKVVVPMHGVENAMSAFFIWQRFPNDEQTQDAMLAEFRKITEDGQHGIRVFFMDLEAPLIGSHHGLEIWERFFALMRGHFKDHIVPLDKAAAYWRTKVTKKDAGSYSYFARYLGAKWTGFHVQIDHILATHKNAEQLGRYTDRQLAVITASDVLCGMDRELRGSVSKNADTGPVIIGVDSAVVAAGHSCLCTEPDSGGRRNTGLRKLVRTRTAKGMLDEAWYFATLEKILSGTR